MMQYLPSILVALSLVVVAARAVVSGGISLGKWSWLPGAVLAGASVAVQGLTGATSLEAVVSALVSAIVVAVGFAQKGHE